MVLGNAAARIIPTASDDHVENFSSQHLRASASAGIIAEYLSEKDSTNIPAFLTVAQLHSETYLQAAFKGRSYSNSNCTVITSMTNGATSSTSKTEGARAYLKFSDFEIGQQKPMALLIKESFSQRSKSAEVQKQNGAELTKNYMELVQDFRQLQPFTRRPDGRYPADTVCVYCSNVKPTSVFFPCQHMCVCNACIKSNQLSTAHTSWTNWCACPVCMADIRLILSHSGKEEEEYWTWLLEIKPSLPSHFKQEFEECGKQLIRKAASRRQQRKSAPQELLPNSRKKFVVGHFHLWTWRMFEMWQYLRRKPTCAQSCR